MISHLMMYLLLMLDNIRHVLSCIIGWGTCYLIVICCISLTCLAVYADGGFSDYKLKEFLDCTYSKMKKFHIIVFVVIWLLFGFKSLIPTTKQMAIIYVVPKVVNNENLKELPNNVLKFVNGYLLELTNNGLKEIDE